MDVNGFLEWQPSRASGPVNHCGLSFDGGLSMHALLR